MSNTKDRWLKDIQNAKTRDAKFITASGEPVEILGTPDMMKDFDYDRDLGYPGQFPYTRGVHANMYRGRLWTMRQFAGFGTPEDTNARFKYLLKNGQTGLSVAFRYRASSYTSRITPDVSSMICGYISPSGSIIPSAFCISCS